MNDPAPELLCGAPQSDEWEAPEEPDVFPWRVVERDGARHGVFVHRRGALWAVDEEGPAFVSQELAVLHFAMARMWRVAQVMGPGDCSAEEREARALQRGMEAARARE